MKHFRYSVCVMLLACAAACGGLGGCSRSQNGMIVMHDQEESPRKGTEISFFGYKADAWNLTSIEAALHQFMDKNPNVTVTYEGVKGFTYWDAFEKRAAAGDMDEVVMVDHDWVLSLSADGQLADLSELDTVGNFNDMAKSQFTNEDGSVYFLPTCISTYGLYINYDLLKSHGQEVPKNLDEFTKVCDYFVGKGITPVIANNYSSLRSLIAAKGLYPVYQKENPQEEIEKFNRGEADLAEALRPGMDLVQTMIEHGWFDCREVSETEQTSDDLEIFAEGARPFMVTGSWASSRVAAMEPGFQYGIHPFPILDGGSVLVVNVDTCIGLSARSAHLDDAKEFLSFLTQPDVICRYCDSQSSYPPVKDSRVPEDKALAPTTKYLERGKNVIGSDFRLRLPLDTSLTECAAQMLDGMNAEEASALLAKLLG